LKKILTVVGARPQFIKIAPVSKILRKHFSETLVHTGQHYDIQMSEVFFKELNIPIPDINLNVGSGSHAKQTSDIIQGIENILIEKKPDLLLVYGDTNSTLAAALAAVKLHIPIAHVEAGLRDIDLFQPEEVNRRLTDVVSDYLFTPSLSASENLYKENIYNGVYFVGDVMYDAIIQNQKKAEDCSSILKDYNLIPNEYYLATIHRPHNTDNPNVLRSIINAFNKLDKLVLFPVHPRTQKVINSMELNYSNLIVTIPLGYYDFLKAELNAYKIITDSGGVQKEAYLINKPCVTIDYTSPWLETFTDGWNILSGPNTEEIIDAVSQSNGSTNHSDWYGDGHASEKIVSYLINQL